MDIDEAKAYCAEYAISALCSGKDFRGLGPLAEYFVRAIAESADKNAKHLFPETTRTTDKFFAMMDEVRNRFVLSIVGQLEERKTLVEASHDLVQTVWEAYINWARQAKEAAERMKAVLTETGHPATPEGIKSAMKDMLS